MNQITVSAPGKLMVFGEHAVVYGKPCIVTAVNQRLKLKARELKEPFFELEAPDVDISSYKKNLKELGKGEIPKGARYVEIATKNFLEKFPQKSGVRFETVSEFKATFGFGSSSAAAVCAIKALSEIYKVNLSNKQIFDLSYKTVLDISGIGSGVDLAAAIYGGTVYFLAGGKMIKPLNTKDFSLVVGFTGIKAETPPILKEVAEKVKKNPSYYNNIFNEMEKLVLTAKNSLVSGNSKKTGELMNLNQLQLSKLRVSSEVLDKLIFAANKAGAFGSKLSGAGIGDCMIALVPNGKIADVEKAIESAGGEVLKVEVGAEGVRVENFTDPKELVVAVDEKDNIISYLPRKEAHDKKILHRTISVLVFNDKGEVMLQKRSMKKDSNPGKWSNATGGHVGKNESYDEAAKREVEEELNLKLKPKFLKKMIINDPAHTTMTQLYIIKSNGPFKFNPEETDEIKFFSKKALKTIFDNLSESSKITLKEYGFLEMQKATAIAPSNIAFTKYWGRKDEKLRLPINGSVAMTISNMLTTTTVEFDTQLKKDDITINNEKQEKEVEKVVKHLDRIRKQASIKTFAKVVSTNSFPTGTGLSSSSSGFAALTVAAATAAGLNLSEKELGILSRQASGASIRSIPAGFVEWLDGDTSEKSYAKTIFPKDHWDIADVVAVVSKERKDVATSQGHEGANTSVFMETRIKGMKKKNETVKKLIKEKDFQKFGEFIEAEALELHAIYITQNPSLIYLTPESLMIIKLCKKWRSEGLPVYFTVNTGQDVHLIVEKKNIKKLETKLKEINEVKQIIINYPGDGTKLSNNHLF